MDIAITRMSSKGQVVIPTFMREDIPKGEQLVIIKSKDALVLKKANKVTQKMKEDLEFARRTEEAYQRIKAGKFREMDFDDFIKEMKTW